MIARLIHLLHVLPFRLRRVRHVTLFGKPGCHLCDDTRALLERLGARYDLEIDEVDITSDPALFRAYDVRIPVVVVDGTTQIEAPIAEQALVRALSQ